MVADNDSPPSRPFRDFHNALLGFFEAPVVWFRTTVVEPNRKEYYWYHQQFRRVPTIDQCYDDDPVCKFEATQQFKRDHKRDSAILNILKQRYEHCVILEGVREQAKCAYLYDLYEDASADWFSKYGDMGYKLDAEKAYFKQKHRMMWERRHGKVGTGMEGNRPRKPLDEQQ